MTPVKLISWEIVVVPNVVAPTAASDLAALASSAVTSERCWIFL